ncbi:exodeoxyribonuclease III [Fibrobacterales bacterium]|nr:exodeoxyribonuclease III [Fibrobacterales bacterium]
MVIYSCNVNGIRAAAQKGLADWFIKAEADIMCFQEVRADEDQIPLELRAFDGYTSFWTACEKKKGYSGVGVYTKISPEEVNHGFDIEEFDEEGRVVQLVFADWVLNNIYFPNGSQNDERLDYKLRFYDAFLENSLDWIERGKHVVTIGDYNVCHKEIDIARPKENEMNSGFLPVERAWVDKYVESGFVDSFRVLHPTLKDAYTWWSNRSGARERNVGWRIDYAFVDEGLKDCIVNASIYPELLFSDHCPISIELEAPFPIVKTPLS